MITRYSKFINESNSEGKITYKVNNLIKEICVCMLLINNNFLDSLLDAGKKARYIENSKAFLTDLKNLLFAKNRMKLGKFVDGKCHEDEDQYKINGIFDSVKFDIDENWNDLVNSRIISRNIIDKLLPDEKLSEDRISSIFWIGPNKNKEDGEDIVLELTDGRQYSFYLNKNIGSKSASFNTFADEIIGTDIDKLYGPEYISKWNKLTQEWIRILHDNANKNVQIHIEKFIDPHQLEKIGHFNYFKIKHRDPRYKHLGEYIKEFDKNLLFFSDLMSEIWKNREICFKDPQRVFNQWMEVKVFILNSKILEHIITDSLTRNDLNDIKKLKDGFKLGDGKIKMKVIKILVEKLGCTERNLYYLWNNGNIFYQIPYRQFFREFYDMITVKFDFHVKMTVQPEEEHNDFTVKFKIELQHEKLLDLSVIVKFSGGEMSEKLSAKYNFDFADDFNYKISSTSLTKNED